MNGLKEPKVVEDETEVVCLDFDEDCEDVKNKVNCWLYQPECGLCPFLKQSK